MEKNMELMNEELEQSQRVQRYLLDGTVPDGQPDKWWSVTEG
jgi:hypothetical protein